MTPFQTITGVIKDLLHTLSKMPSKTLFNCACLTRFHQTHQSKQSGNLNLKQMDPMNLTQAMLSLRYVNDCLKCVN